MVVSKEEAESYIRKFLQLQDSLRNSNVLNQVTDPAAGSYYSSSYISFVFEKDEINTMFSDNPNANGLRIYYGAHDTGEPTIVLITAELKLDAMTAKNSSSGPPVQWPRLKGTSGGKGYADFDIHDDSIY